MFFAFSVVRFRGLFRGRALRGRVCSAEKSGARNATILRVAKQGRVCNLFWGGGNQKTKHWRCLSEKLAVGKVVPQLHLAVAEPPTLPPTLKGSTLPALSAARVPIGTFMESEQSHQRRPFGVHLRGRGRYALLRVAARGPLCQLQICQVGGSCTPSSVADACSLLSGISEVDARQCCCSDLFLHE